MVLIECHSHVLGTTLGVLVLNSLGRGSSARQCQAPGMDSLKRCIICSLCVHLFTWSTRIEQKSKSINCNQYSMSYARVHTQNGTSQVTIPVDKIGIF